jgi:hypothetical protein
MKAMLKSQQYRPVVYYDGWRKVETQTPLFQVKSARVCGNACQDVPPHTLNPTPDTPCPSCPKHVQTRLLLY